MLSILLLGPPQITRDEQPIRVTRRKSRALVYYLAAHDKPLTREQLLAFFWPDLERSAAQQTLRTALHSLRKALGPALVADNLTLSLAPDCEVDVRIFESRLAPPTPLRSASESIVTHLQSPVSNPSTPPSAPLRARLRTSLQLLTSTLDLYRGDFLSGFTLPDTPQFDDWAGVERERYRRLAVRGLSALSQLHESNRDYTAALDAIDRALAFDPLQEDLQRMSLRLHYLAGDRAGAIRRYASLRKLLDEELGVPPMAETRALYDAIITDTLTDSGHPSSTITLHPRPTKFQAFGSAQAKSPFSNLQALPATSLPFTGRSVELQTLGDLASSHKLALIEGEPGIGKTRLAEEFMRTGDALRLVGKGRELEQALPYQPVIEALRSLTTQPEWPALRAGVNLPAAWLAEAARLLPELAALVPSPQPASFAADESRLWEGLHQFLIALARQRRVVVFVDDLHWADGSSLALIGYLVRQAEAVGAPIFFIATAQPAAPRSPFAVLLQALTREGRLARIPLKRLASEEVVSLARHHSPAYAQPLAAWLMQSSEGNPYVLHELIRHVREHDILRPDGSVNLSALSASPVVPQTIYTLIQSRLARLSDAARRVLDAAVAVGREFEFEVVARAAALSEAAALDALDELQTIGLMYPLDEKRYAFDHNLTMEVAYREVGEPRHRLLHRRVAEALESIYRDRIDSIAGLLAFHFAEGNDPARTAPYAFRAGQAAAALAAWKEAVAFYEQALIGSPDDRRGPIYMALGEAHMQTGELSRASEAFRAALALAESNTGHVDADEARLALGQSFILQARYAEAIALAQAVRAAGRPDNVVRAEILWGTALSVEGADLAGAADHLRSAASLCSDRPDAATLAHIKFELGSVAAQQGDLAQAVELYREALAVARSEDTEATLLRQILALNNLAYHLHLLGDPAAIEHAHAGLSLAQEKGILGLQPFLLSTLGEIALVADDVQTAEAHFTRGLAIAEQFAIPERIAGLTANLGRVAARRGETALAIHRLSTAVARADALGTRHLAAQIRLWLVPLLPPAEAHTQLAEARAIAESGGRRRLLDEVTRLEGQISSI